MVSVGRVAVRHAVRAVRHAVRLRAPCSFSLRLVYQPQARQLLELLDRHWPLRRLRARWALLLMMLMMMVRLGVRLRESLVLWWHMYMRLVVRALRR